MLRMVDQGSGEDLHNHLWEGVRTGLILRADDSYRFLHDRVQEAAYSQIPTELRAEAHLHIGMLLAAHAPPEKRDESIFEIVNQLNRGSHLVAIVEFDWKTARSRNDGPANSGHTHREVSRIRGVLMASVGRRCGLLCVAAQRQRLRDNSWGYRIGACTSSRKKQTAGDRHSMG